MKPDFILTRRSFDRRGFYDLVYEWEDVLSKITNIPLKDEKQILCNPILSRVPLLFKLLMGEANLFYYDMYSNLLIERNRNLKNVSTCIIDFFVSAGEISKFERNYDKYGLVYISSLEAFDFLKVNNCQMNIAHLPLTLPDKYRITRNTMFDKKYDLVIVGRTNKVLAEYLARYKEENKLLNIISKKEVDGRMCFVNNEGKPVTNDISRKSYIEALRLSKVILYSTPGIDGGEVRTKGLSQVTPRFLEAIAAGCHVISRYKENSDTDFFELNKMTSNIGSYEEFKREFDRAIHEDVDMGKYEDYLSKHYTSTIVEQFTKG